MVYDNTDLFFLEYDFVVAIFFFEYQSLWRKQKWVEYLNSLLKLFSKISPINQNKLSV